MNNPAAQEARARLAPQEVFAIQQQVLMQAVRALIAESPQKEAVHRQLDSLVAQMLCWPPFLDSQDRVTVAKDAHDTLRRPGIDPQV